MFAEIWVSSIQQYICLFKFYSILIILMKLNEAKWIKENFCRLRSILFYILFLIFLLGNPLEINIIICFMFVPSYVCKCVWLCLFGTVSFVSLFFICLRLFFCMVVCLCIGFSLAGFCVHGISVQGECCKLNKAILNINYSKPVFWICDSF